jgi:hypothetical protein
MRLRSLLRERRWHPPTGEMVEHDFAAETRAQLAARHPNWSADLLEQFVPAPSGRIQQWDLNGVVAWEADLPPRRHRCYVHTRALLNFDLIERCPCGGVCIHSPSLEGDGHYWMERNSRGGGDCA